MEYAFEFIKQNGGLTTEDTITLRKLESASSRMRWQSPLMDTGMFHPTMPYQNIQTPPLQFFFKFPVLPKQHTIDLNALITQSLNLKNTQLKSIFCIKARHRKPKAKIKNGGTNSTTVTKTNHAHVVKTKTSIMKNLPTVERRKPQSEMTRGDEQAQPPRVGTNRRMKTGVFLSRF
ncbi:Vignain [Senna tora]|uniref:Vignain n=1 Tax=Senna tora TaxID=362788 RepID=A0A835C338_9FABA|nr:Vignain [Senna tora]